MKRSSILDIKLNAKQKFFYFACFLLWLKTLLTQYHDFHLQINNSVQTILLVLNPIGSILFLLGLSVLVKGKKFYSTLMLLQLILSTVLYANVLYYRFYSDFITLPTLFQTKNMNDLGGSIFALINGYDFLFYFDTIILLVILRKRNKFEFIGTFTRRSFSILYLSAIFMIGSTIAMAEMDRPQLLTRMFDRNYIVKYLGIYNFIFYDILQSTRTSKQRVMADSDDITEIINYTKSLHAEPNPQYFAAAKGLNVIYIHLESFQNFLIDYKIDGEEVTPFLNSLTSEPNSFYFDNFFHQTAQGKTSDAEFLIDNSLYGLPQGAVFTTRGLNTYHAAPGILDNDHYTSAVFHGNNQSFWNRDVIYKSFGYDYFFDSSFYEMSPENVVNYGLKDKPFFTGSLPILETLPQPFYAKFITLSNHYPYPIAEEEASIKPFNSGDGSVDRYFQTARYSDEALREFFLKIKEDGLLDSSMIILYGDHYGISENHNKAMKQVMGEEITPFKNAQLQRVPLLIRIPGVAGKKMSQYGGQIDLLPTILHLLGMETKEFLFFGTDLFSDEHEQVIPFRNGDFASPTITRVTNKYFDTKNGHPVEKNKAILLSEQFVKQQLELSDQVVNGDLLRFYTPNGFNLIDHYEYDYRNFKP
ncbi:LTA synthase family protein [Bacillus sp. DJP31]|uniref:LTA synthase family protein n=1 Tax=Bacillus sp. DJP31 TaxID=3409789 RepID=UPI003BB5F467